MSSAPTDCRVPDPSDKLDAKADGQFQAVNRRAGYGDDRLDRIIATARKGWTLAAGEGLVLVQEIDRLRSRKIDREDLPSALSEENKRLREEIDQLRKGKEIVTSMLFDQVPLLNRMQDTLDRLREPSEKVLLAAVEAVSYGASYAALMHCIPAAVAAAEREVSA